MQKTVSRMVSMGAILGVSLILFGCSNAAKTESGSEPQVSSVSQSMVTGASVATGETSTMTSSIPLQDSALETDTIRDHAEFVAGPNGADPVELRAGDSFMELSVTSVEAYDAGGYYSWVKAAFEGEITLKGQLMLYREDYWPPYIDGSVFFIPDEASASLLPYYYPDSIDDESSKVRWIRMENEDFVRQMTDKESGQFNNCVIRIQDYMHFYSHIEAFDSALLAEIIDVGDYSETIQR